MTMHRLGGPFAAFLILVLFGAAPAGAQWGRYVPGTLARDRLRGLVTTLFSPDRVVVSRTGGPPVLLSPEQSRRVVAGLRDLLLDDALYAGNAAYQRDTPDYALSLTRGNDLVNVSVWLDQPYLYIHGADPPIFRPPPPGVAVPASADVGIAADYTPVAPRLVQLLRAVAPEDPRVRAFRPKPAPSPPVALQIPPAIRNAIGSLRPGMTRADVLRLFSTEGGISTQYWNHYVYCGPGVTGTNRLAAAPTVGGRLVKVNVAFAPRGAEVLWIAGRGVLVHQGDRQRFRGPERPDDVILSVSMPYLENFIAD